MQGPAGKAGWRVHGEGWWGIGMCESVKYCTETPPAAANVVRGKKGRVGSNSGGTKKCSACRQGFVQAWHTVTI